MLVLNALATLFSFGLVIYYASGRNWETMMPWLLIFMIDIMYFVIKFTR